MRRAVIMRYRHGRNRRHRQGLPHGVVAALHPAARMGEAQPRGCVDGEPTPAQLATAQKATRPAKPESLAWETLKDQWRVTTARVRSSNVDVIATVGRRAPWAITASPGSVND
jgi:hypothetical protein